MFVLGIETSCDETSVAVVKDGEKVLSNIVASSLKFHQKYGGVIPEIASRMSLESITQVADLAVKQSGIKLKDIGLVSVTCGPGLLGSLLVGLSFAKAVGLALNVPLLGVNHVYGHLYANFLDRKSVKLPVIALVVSGGHTNLYLVEDFNQVRILGQSLDDASGEAFDKVAKILGLGYPGGPVIDKLAKKGNSRKINFSCSDTRRPFDFSFSGIKTAVLYHTKKQTQGRLSFQDKCDICASFQEAVVDTLVNKTLAACKAKKVKKVVVGGGVASNTRLRDKLFSAAAKNKVEVFFPQFDFCLDNAAMVAGLGYQLFKKGYKSGLDLNVQLN